jgi:bla regulator protein BlaR1
MIAATFLDIVVKATIIMTLALAGAWVARGARAAVRHVVLVAAFAGLLILPISSLVAPTVRVLVPAAVRDAIAPLDIMPIGETVSSRTSSAASATESSTTSASMWLSLSSLLLAVWATGVAALLLPVVVGLWQVRSLRRSGLPWLDGRARLEALAADAKIRRRIDVLLHEALPGPMTCGVAHPAIVLPIDARTWTNEDLSRAIVHELEHVRRSDWVSHCLARVVAACYWFHPIVWAAWRQLSLEAERACDDAVLRRSDATAYADQLVALAQRLSQASHHPQMAMASRKDLATRVVAVLDSDQPRGRAGAPCVGAAVALTVVLAAALSTIRIVAAEQAPTVASAVRQTFDAATIKPCEVEENPTGARGTAGGTNATFSPGRFFVPCVTTEQLIYLAYASYGAREDERLVNDDPGTASNPTKVRGGPAWVHSLRDKYQIEATAAGATERTVLMGAMLQSLLEDRFHLKLHRETEEVALYGLTVAKGGLKLRPMKEGDCDPDRLGPIDQNAAKPRCGNLTMAGVEGKTRWTFGGAKLSDLAGQLSRLLGVHVVDQTGITDQFVMRLEFTREPDVADIESTSVFTALNDQFGLKLVKTKGPRGFLVIDAIERPTPDGSSVLVHVPSRARGAGRPIFSGGGR